MTATPPQLLPKPLLAQTQTSNPAVSLITRLVSYLFPSKPRHYRPATGPLIYPGLYKSYNDIFRALSLISYHKSTTTVTATTVRPSASSPPQSPYTISWLVHKPSPNTQFRKSTPPNPDFHVVVLDARVHSCIPTLSELGALLDSSPDDELPADRKMEQRMKHGVRNAVLAVVDCGLVSYLRLADVCSGERGKVFETKVARGGKRAGGGGGRGGSGRGRGRGGKR